MKKYLSLIQILVIGIAVMLTGCEKKAETPQPAPQPIMTHACSGTGARSCSNAGARADARACQTGEDVVSLTVPASRHEMAPLLRGPFIFDASFGPVVV